jgi:integrase/recombinase XerD
VSPVPEMSLPGLVAELVAARHAGGYRFKIQERVLRQFAGRCAREGYPDGSITREAVSGFLYGQHLRSCTIRRNELALRQLTEYARAAGWDAFTPAAATAVRIRHQPPYVFTDDEIRRLFAAIDSQPMSSFSNKAMVDPVLFRVLYGAGLRISEALHLTLADVDTRAGTLRIRDSKNGESRTVPVTGRLTVTLEGCITAAHPAPEPGDHVFYSVAAGRPISQPTAYLRFRGYLADAGIPHFTGGPHPHSLRHSFAVASLRRWAAQGADLAVMLPYLACYMGHAGLRGTQYYLRLTADAYPEVMARAQIRFGYVIPAPPGAEQRTRALRHRRILPGAGWRSTSPTTWPGSAQPRPRPFPPTGTR